MRFLQSLEKNYRRLRDDYRRRAQNEILKQRWAGKSDRPPVVREDRRAEIQSEFKALGVTRFARFEAVPMVRWAAPSMKPCCRRRQS